MRRVLITRDAQSALLAVLSVHAGDAFAVIYYHGELVTTLIRRDATAEEQLEFRAFVHKVAESNGKFLVDEFAIGKRGDA